MQPGSGAVRQLDPGRQYEHCGRHALRRLRLNAQSVTEQAHERLDGVCRGNGAAVLSGAGGEHGECLCRLHLRRGVAHVEDANEPLDRGVACFPPHIDTYASSSPPTCTHGLIALEKDMRIDDKYTSVAVKG